MIEIVILAYLCLTIAALCLRVILFIFGQDQGRLAKFASASWTVLYAPFAGINRLLNLAYLGLALILLLIWLAPH